MSKVSKHLRFKSVKILLKMAVFGASKWRNWFHVKSAWKKKIMKFPHCVLLKRIFVLWLEHFVNIVLPHFVAAKISFFSRISWLAKNGNDPDLGCSSTWLFRMSQKEVNVAEKFRSHLFRMRWRFCETIWDHFFKV